MKPTSDASQERAQKSFIIRKIRDPAKKLDPVRNFSATQTLKSFNKLEELEEEKRTSRAPSSISTSVSTYNSLSSSSLSRTTSFASFKAPSKKLLEFKAQYHQDFMTEREAVIKATPIGAIIAKQSGVINKCLSSKTPGIFDSGIKSIVTAFQSYSLEDLKPFLYDIFLKLKERLNQKSSDKINDLLEHLLQQQSVIQEKKKGALPTVFQMITELFLEEYLK